MDFISDESPHDCAHASTTNSVADRGADAHADRVTHGGTD
jgi:hypothetical protein